MVKVVTRWQDIPLPEPGPNETTVALLGDLIVFCTLAHDSDCSNPLDDCAAMGTITVELNYRDPVFRILDREPDAVPLHGWESSQGSRWSVDIGCANAVIAQRVLYAMQGDDEREFEFALDRNDDFSGVHAVWQPDKHLLSEAEALPPGSKERSEQMRTWAAQACVVYVAWANGETYAYSVEVYTVRRDRAGEPYDELDDYRRDEAVFEESCGGILNTYPDATAAYLREAVSNYFAAAA